MSTTPRILDAGDAAFTIEFGDAIDLALVARVNALEEAVTRERSARPDKWRGLIETMPTFRSLTIFFDPLLTERAQLLEALRPLLASESNAPAAGRHWRLPACYAEEFGPDLADCARTLDASVDELIALHSGTEYAVYMLGFLPGFPFMGDVPERLRLPRRNDPRKRVPPGSVAVATQLTTIYPWESPGGWHLLGRCPVPLFDATQASPALLAAGDRVRFEPVAMPEYRRVEAAVRAGEFNPRHWQVDAA